MQEKLTTISDAYQQMADDEAREAEALEWTEATIGDVAKNARSTQMTITLTPETEARLCEIATRESKDLSTIVEELIRLAWEWEEWDREDTIAGVRRGEQAAAEGRERPLAAFLADQRTKYGFPDTWPDDVTDDQDICHASQ